MTSNTKIRTAVFLTVLMISVRLVGAAEQTRTYLKEKFQDGDIPTGQDFKDLIDSALNLVDDGLTVYRIGADSSGRALRLDTGAVVDSSLSYTLESNNPPLAPLWAGHFGFLPLELQDASHASHYGYLQMEMASGPLPPPPGLPGPAIFVEYLVYQTDANVALTTSAVPEPTTAALIAQESACFSLAAADIEASISEDSSFNPVGVHKWQPRAFEYVIYIRASPAKLWQALIDPELTRRYWVETWQDCGWQIGSSWKLMIPDGRVGDAGEVLEIEPEKRLVLSWRNEFLPELRSEGFSRITCDLESVGDDCVKLSVTHEMDKSDSKLIAGVSTGWPSILSSLKSLLETGESLTHTRKWPEGM